MPFFFLSTPSDFLILLARWRLAGERGLHMTNTQTEEQANPHPTFLKAWLPETSRRCCRYSSPLPAFPLVNRSAKGEYVEARLMLPSEAACGSLPSRRAQEGGEKVEEHPVGPGGCSGHQVLLAGLTSSVPARMRYSPEIYRTLIFGNMLYI